MSNNNYDFRVSQSACVKALEEYIQMETLMESEKETLLNAIDNTDGYWFGSAHYITKFNINSFLNSGIYDSSYKKVKKMHTCLEKALPQINLLLARCEGFVEQLQHNIYVEPCKPAEGDNRELNGGILALNYDYVSQISDTCDMILKENRQIIMSLTEVLHNCEDLLGGTDKDMARLTAASDKVKRIENYKNAFQAYASGVKALEFDLELRLREIIDEDGENNPYEISGETAAQMAGGFTDYDNISAVEMIATEIFKKDVSEWSEEEIDFIARTWDDAVQNGKTDFIELYTREMFIETYSQTTRIVSQGRSEKPIVTCDYQFESDEQKIELIMSHLDPKTQGLAYYTLNRLKHMSSDVMTIYGYEESIKSRATHNIEVTDEDGIIQIKVSAAVDSELGYADGRFDFAISLYDMNEIIDARKEADLEERLQFSPEQIEQMRMSAVTDADVEFLDHLTGGEYEQAFDVNPQKRGSLLIDCLANYILALEDKNNTLELQKVINGALLTDTTNNRCIKNTSGQYMEALKETFEEYITAADTYILTLKDGSKEYNELIQWSDQVYKQYTLWTTVEKVYLDEFDMDIWVTANQYAYGIYYARISDLKTENLSYDFNIHMDYKDEETKEVRSVFPDGKYIKCDTAIIPGYDLAESVLIDKTIALEKEKDSWEWVLKDGINWGEEQALSAIPLPLGISLPVNGCLFVGDEAKKRIEMIQQLESNRVLLKNGICSQGLQIIFSLYDTETDKEEKDGHIPIICKGIILPETTKRLADWGQEGIIPYLRSIGCTDEDISEILSDLREKHNNPAWNLLINGCDSLDGDSENDMPSEEEIVSFLKPIYDTVIDHAKDYITPIEIPRWINGGE